ncbi:type IV conjugative transfer system pilin TraA [Vibrio mediterranei]|uniref:Pilin n=1 Tax=Vibrio mediterranei TaxID=689 RepID=A0ABX5D6S8_9VIBR|nr:type IV conjugative transfer system pilin TraA [Vibrio mediterranei]PCD85528.1 type IV conjugative transfer system pilin TraA [Vibrio mediterranei]PRQ65383.1 type IV conjugative transfer system pilin TraA [Vibrio mediterranei]
MKNLSSINTTTFALGVLLTAVTLLISYPASAVDLFDSAKTTIKDTAGEGSAVENGILAIGAIGAAAGGFMTRNWMGAVGGFTAGMIFWEVIKPLVGLA